MRGARGDGLIGAAAGRALRERPEVEDSARSVSTCKGWRICCGARRRTRVRGLVATRTTFSAGVLFAASLRVNNYLADFPRGPLGDAARSAKALNSITHPFPLAMFTRALSNHSTRSFRKAW